MTRDDVLRVAGDLGDLLKEAGTGEVLAEEAVKLAAYIVGRRLTVGWSAEDRWRFLVSAGIAEHG